MLSLQPAKKKAKGNAGLNQRMALNLPKEIKKSLEKIKFIGCSDINCYAVSLMGWAEEPCVRNVTLCYMCIFGALVVPTFWIYNMHVLPFG